MSSVQTAPYNTAAYASDSEDGQAAGGRKSMIHTTTTHGTPRTGSLAEPAGKLLKPPGDKPALLIGIKLDLEAEIHLTARVRGDITIGLY